MSNATETRYTLEFNPECPTCGVPSEHSSDLGVWICPYCGRLAIEYTERDNDEPVLSYPPGDDPVETIKVLGEFATHDGLKSMLSTPYASKEDLLDLPKDATSRRWNPDRSAWTVDARAIQVVKERLREAGWSVIDLVQLRTERQERG